MKFEYTSNIVVVTAWYSMLPGNLYKLYDFEPANGWSHTWRRIYADRMKTPFLCMPSGTIRSIEFALYRDHFKTVSLIKVE